MGELEDLKKKEIARLNRVCNDWRERYLRKCNEVDELIKALEQEPKTGHWDLVNRDGVNKYVCSECDNEPLLIGESYPVFKLSDYCPYCGAKMEVQRRLQ